MVGQRRLRGQRGHHRAPTHTSIDPVLHPLIAHAPHSDSHQVHLVCFIVLLVLMDRIKSCLNLVLDVGLVPDYMNYALVYTRVLQQLSAGVNVRGRGRGDEETGWPQCTAMGGGHCWCLHSITFHTRYHFSYSHASYC